MDAIPQSNFKNQYNQAIRVAPHWFLCWQAERKVFSLFPNQTQGSSTASNHRKVSWIVSKRQTPAPLLWFLLPVLPLCLPIPLGEAVKSRGLVESQNFKAFLSQFFKLLRQTTRLMYPQWKCNLSARSYKFSVIPAAGYERNPSGYSPQQLGLGVPTQFLKIMNRSKNKLKSKSLGINPAYEDIYRALKSPRSFDPFMGMQLGAVRLPPSFSFNTKNSIIEGYPGDNPIARFKTKEWIFSINITNYLILNPNLSSWPGDSSKAVQPILITQAIQ